MTISNLFFGDSPKSFYLWIDPSHSHAAWNIGTMGCAFSAPLSTNGGPEDHLLFIPNPNFKQVVVSPYQNNIIKRMRAEYYLDWYRPKNYPSRMSALFLLDSQGEALAYQEIHKNHVNDRILVDGTTSGNYMYSKHDSGWFDFMCLDHSLDDDTIKNCVDAYWAGETIASNAGKISSCGNQWTQSPTMEILFHGTIIFSEEMKLTVRHASLDARNSRRL